jgi:hypothetical protein
MPAMPTTMLNSTIGSAAILMSFFIRSSSGKPPCRQPKGTLRGHGLLPALLLTSQPR